MYWLCQYGIGVYKLCSLISTCHYQNIYSKKVLSDKGRVHTAKKYK